MDRIIVSREELARALAVWLHVMPKGIWRELEKHELAALQKRQGDRPDVHGHVARWITGQFERVQWEVSRDPAWNIFSDSGTPEPPPDPEMLRRTGT